jgi:hypothetical protein
MQVRVIDPPQPPFPQHPQPPQTRAPQVQPPMVYVYEPQRWEYKIVVRDTEEKPLSEQDLNGFGSGGWELVGVAALPPKVHFYFKRHQK